MVTRVDKFLGGLSADVTNVANVHATENRVAFGHGDTNPTANVHVVGNILATTSITATGGFLVPNDGDIGSASATDAMQISSAGIVTFKDDIKIKDAGTIGSASAPTAIGIASDGIVTFVDDIKIKDGGTIGTATTPTAITIAADGDTAILGGLGVAGNTSPVGGSFGGISLGTPANVVIRTAGNIGGGNVIIGDATATSGFNLDVRGTSNTGALTTTNLTVNGTLDCGTL